MKQLAQKLKNGKVEIIEVPPPLMNSGMILVRNHYSLISPGTEGKSILTARKNLIGKALEKPEQVKQVVDVLKEQGPTQTYRTVMKKLDSYSPLGYSSAGRIIDLAPDVHGYSIGDFVACAGGGYANHAEIISVPVNLCVKLNKDADLKKAAYNTLGAIALQGIRQASLALGETCAVIGLGLIGQLTCLLLKAGGIKTIGIDINQKMVEIAAKNSADISLESKTSNLLEKIREYTAGIGVDAVIITASASTTDPVNLAGQLLRKKGKVIIVGLVPTGFSRESYYNKELELRMSTSYGPGRYDPVYEEKGIDYPVGYVRWTEKRNMIAFQEFIYSGKIDIDYLTSHTFEIDESTQAYNTIFNTKEPHLGILIKYKDHISNDFPKKIKLHSKPLTGKLGIGFIGAGSYALGYLLPNIPSDSNIVLKGIMTAKGTSSLSAAEKYGFEFCTSDENDLFLDKKINTLFIATRHNKHAEYTIKGLKEGKDIFVEKPLCLNENQLSEITSFFKSPSKESGGKQGISQVPRLMIGFNRRFSTLSQMLKKQMGEGQAAMLYRIHAGSLPPDSWILDEETGGGRIIGEICHFIDFMTFMCESRPYRVYASTVDTPQKEENTVHIILDFENGSIGSILYIINGSKSNSKEYFEISKHGKTGILKDFKSVHVFNRRKLFSKKLKSQDKGQKQMLKAFFESIKSGSPSPIPFQDIYAATQTTFNIKKSIRIKKPVEMKVDFSIL